MRVAAVLVLIATPALACQHGNMDDLMGPCPGIPGSIFIDQTPRTFGKPMPDGWYLFQPSDGCLQLPPALGGGWICAGRPQLSKSSD